MTSRFAVIFEASATGYSAYVPELPGCVAAGSTLDEARKFIREAIEMHVEGMLEDGLSVPASCPVAVEIIELKTPVKA